MYKINLSDLNNNNMAKKQTFTVGSKDNMRSRLQELKDYTFNPLTGVNMPEEQYEFNMA
jgi:hypothetical protein